VATATAVGQRHVPPVVLPIRAGEMARQGHTFYLSANGVWLVDEQSEASPVLKSQAPGPDNVRETCPRLVSRETVRRA
jgi:RNA:NAD 2'-phosphotransferase (TPT1/KptA family)